MTGMKKLVLSLLVCVSAANVFAAGGKAKGSSAAMQKPKVLVMAPSDNVKSNYYVKEMLAEGTGIDKDSISYVYNNVIGSNLEKLSQKSGVVLLNACDSKDKQINSLARSMRISGSGQDAAADMSAVDKNALHAEMQRLGAKYLLVIGQHYLKYQEQPLKTTFHFVSYSVYDINDKKLGGGSVYFTSFDPQGVAEMAKSSVKSSKKIVSDVERMVEKEQPVLSSAKRD